MERKEEISLRDSGWSRLKRVMAWIRGFDGSGEKRTVQGL